MDNYEPVTYDDLVTLTAWMLAGDYSAEQIVEAVRCPSRYADELIAALRARGPGHRPVSSPPRLMHPRPSSIGEVAS